MCWSAFDISNKHISNVSFQSYEIKTDDHLARCASSSVRIRSHLTASETYNIFVYKCTLCLDTYHDFASNQRAILSRVHNQSYCHTRLTQIVDVIYIGSINTLGKPNDFLLRADTYTLRPIVCKCQEHYSRFCIVVTLIVDPLVRFWRFRTPTNFSYGIRRDSIRSSTWPEPVWHMVFGNRTLSSNPRTLVSVHVGHDIVESSFKNFRFLDS